MPIKKFIEVELYPDDNEFTAICKKFNIKIKKKTVKSCLKEMRKQIKKYMEFRKIKEDSIIIYGLDNDYGKN